MSDNSTCDTMLARLMKALSAGSDAELARALGISPQSVSGARRRGEVPPAWVQLCAEKTGCNAHWLFFGQGPMFLPPHLSGDDGEVATRPEVDMITIPLVEARLSAGTGSLEVDGGTEG